MYKKEDPRAIRTKEMLKEAVLTLLQEGTPLNKLTVLKVSQRARLNRTTFYLHYEDMQQLVQHLTDEIMGELTNKMASLMHVKGMSQEKKLIQLLDYLYALRHQILVLIQSEHLEAKLFALMHELILTRREISGRVSPKSLIASDIKAASLVGIIMWWLRSGMHYSAEYVAIQIHAMYRS